MGSVIPERLLLTMRKYSYQSFEISTMTHPQVTYFRYRFLAFILLIFICRNDHLLESITLLGISICRGGIKASWKRCSKSGVLEKVFRKNVLKDAF